MKIRKKSIYDAVQVLDADEVCEWFKENVIDTEHEKRAPTQSFITKDDISQNVISLDFCYDPFNKDILQKVVIHAYNDRTKEVERGGWIYLYPEGHSNRRTIDVMSESYFNDFYEVVEDKN